MHQQSGQEPNHQPGVALADDVGLLVVKLDALASVACSPFRDLSEELPNSVHADHGVGLVAALDVLLYMYQCVESGAHPATESGE